MKIRPTKNAIIEHHETQQVFEIDSDLIDWQVTGSDKKSMGAEVLYEAVIEHEELGTLIWTFVEYPVGAEDDRDFDIGDHKRLQNFDFEIVHENPDTANEAAIEEMTNWFHSMFCDPVEEMPYNGREGGYSYPYGGPYNALEELEEKFLNQHDFSLIKIAADRVEVDGIFDWAPSPNHPDQIAARDEYYEQFNTERAVLPSSSDLENLKARLQLQSGAFDFSQVRDQQKELLRVVKSLRNEIAASQEKSGMIGHNNPPQDYSEQELVINLTIVQNELEKDRPDADEIVEKLTWFRSLIVWCGQKAEIFLDAGLKTAGAATFTAIVAKVTGYLPQLEAIVSLGYNFLLGLL